MKKIIKQLLTIIACIPFFISCIAFQENSARKIKNFPIASGKSPQIYLETNFQVVGVEVTSDWRQTAVDHINALAENIVVKSKLFEWNNSKETSDYKLIISTRDDSNSSMMSLSAYTFFLIPSKGTEEYRTAFTLIDNKKNKEIGTKTINHTFTRWLHLLLIFGAPFATPKSVEKKMWNEVFKDAIVWAHEKIQKK